MWESFCITAKGCVFVRAVYLCITTVISSLLLKALDCNLYLHTSWLQSAATHGTWLSHFLQLLTELGFSYNPEVGDGNHHFFTALLWTGSTMSLESCQSNFMEFYSFVRYLMEAQLTCCKQWNFFSSKFRNRFNNLNCVLPSFLFLNYFL